MRLSYARLLYFRLHYNYYVCISIGEIAPGSLDFLPTSTGYCDLHTRPILMKRVLLETSEAYLSSNMCKPTLTQVLSAQEARARMRHTRTDSVPCPQNRSL